MRGAILYGPRDVRFEERETPKIVKPTDAIIRISATCVCGSDLWPYRGIQPIAQPTPMGHEYCGIVEEVGSAVTSIKPTRASASLLARSHQVGVEQKDQSRQGVRPDFASRSSGGGLPRDGRAPRDQDAATPNPMIGTRAL